MNSILIRLFSLFSRTTPALPQKAVLQSYVELNGQFYGHYLHVLEHGQVEYLTKTSKRPKKQLHLPYQHPSILAEPPILVTDHRALNDKAAGSTLEIINNQVVFCSAKGCEQFDGTESLDGLESRD